MTNPILLGAEPEFHGPAIASSSKRSAAASMLRGHIPALDGLRGLAILGVLFFHSTDHFQCKTSLGRLFDRSAQSGWAGVDLFFVLSGFLITGILLDTKDSPHCFRNFYVRRTLRIFPLYYATLFVVFCIVPHLTNMTAPGIQLIVANQGWFWTYTTNLGFVFQHKVFGNADWLRLNQFWSLAVEEQFYLFWPMVVFLLRPKVLIRVCAALIVGALVLRCGLAGLHMRPGAMYFPTPCRIDSLATGALVAVLVRKPDGIVKLLPRARQVAAWSGVLLALMILWRKGLLFNDVPTLTVGLTLLAILAATLLVISMDRSPKNLVRPVMEARLLRILGKYSYAMYVLHELLMPAFETWFSTTRLLRIVRWELAAVLVHSSLFVLVSLGAALLSWHLLEKHCLKLKRFFEYAEPSEDAALPK
jgi:peptidoglycan/LPS O-acetylase OafA/YrhL